MNSKKVIGELKKKYPGKKIIKNDENNPTEILCEIDPSANHSKYSLAVAIIDKSFPHFHGKSKETYKVIKGKLSLFVDGKKHELKKRDKLEVEPGQTHWAEGDETWIECYSEPGWTLKDHIMKKKYIAMCGLDCSSCPAFIATQNDDDKLRKKTAEEWTKRYRTDGRNRPSLKAKDIYCKGCLSSGPVYLYCRQCKIRQCGLKKGIKNCEECEKYKCNKLIELQSHLF